MAVPDPELAHPAPPAPPRLMRRRVPETAPITPSSIALFRLGEVCNHHCPMCSNSGRPEGLLIPTAELLRRISWLAELGMPRVVVTGGEPTVHPGFWQVIEHLCNCGLAWDINTNGNRFGEPAWTARAADLGLLRAIVSLHSHDPERSAQISGTTVRGHELIVRGIDELLRAGVQVMVNCVLTTLTIPDFVEFMRFCAERWGQRVVLKLVFPSTAGKGGAWEGIALRYADVVAPLQAAQGLATERELEVVFENLPPCVLGETEAQVRNVARSGFGESHYLEDLQGRQLFAIDHIEAWFNAYAESCRGCRAFASCPGVAEAYLRRYGAGEFEPLR